MEISPELFEKKRKNPPLQTKRKRFPKRPRKNPNHDQNQEQNAHLKAKPLKRTESSMIVAPEEPLEEQEPEATQEPETTPEPPPKPKAKMSLELT